MFCYEFSQVDILTRNVSVQCAQVTRLVPGGRMVIEAFAGPRLIILLLKSEKGYREFINGSPVARRPLEIGMGYLIFQFVAQLGYWKCLVTCLVDHLIFDLGYLLFGPSGPGGLPGLNS